MHFSRRVRAPLFENMKAEKRTEAKHRLERLAKTMQCA
jgi:hypothetical protein